MAFMEVALEQAKLALKKGEVPVGAVIEKDGKVVAIAYNKKHKKNMPTAHAEILAIEKACKKLKNWRLDGCNIYVSLMPCPMCAGAIVACRLEKCIVGTVSPEKELIQSIFNDNSQNHKVELVVQENSQCKNILKSFFKNKRK